MNKSMDEFTKGYLSSFDINPDIENGLREDWQNIAIDIEYSTEVFLQGLPNDKQQTITRRVRAVKKRFKSKHTKQRAIKKR